MREGKHENIEEKRKSRGAVKALKIIGIIILILVLLAAGVGIGGYIYLKNTFGKMQYQEINKDEIEINEGVKETLKGYRMIALFGVDSRANELEKGTRSDCIILAIIDQKTKKVNLVSVYRDTFLKISGRELDKTNHAYAFGGAQLALSTLNTNLDLNMTEFVTVNFDSLVDIVDAVDGIDMTITNAELTVGKYNDYVQKTAKIVGKSTPSISSAGKHTLNGIQATAYARLRYTAGGDYRRTERMREVLMAIVEKAKKMSVSKLTRLANTILPEVYTNIKPDEIIGILPQLATYSFQDSIGWPFETKGSQSIPGRGKIWYGIPVTLESNVKRLHQEVLGQEDYEVSETVKTISNSIVNKSGYK